MKKAIFSLLLAVCTLTLTAQEAATDSLTADTLTLAHRLERIEEITNLPMGNGIVLQNFVLFYQIQLYLRKSGNQKALK